MGGKHRGYFALSGLCHLVANNLGRCPRLSHCAPLGRNTMVLPVSCCPLSVTVTFVFSPNGASYESLGHRPRYTHATTQAPKGRDNRLVILVARNLGRCCPKLSHCAPLGRNTIVLPLSCCPLAVTVTFVFSPKGASYESLGHRPRYTHATTQALKGRDNR